VRMVIDPAGKGIIATYTNDLDGQGGIVFDASPLRFSAPLANSYDNRTYILNVATWLEENSSAPAQKQILVYSMADSSADKASMPLGEMVLVDLAKEGFTVKMVRRKDIPQVSRQLLAECGQLWLFFDRQAKNGLSAGELQTLADHNANNRGTLVIAADPQPDGFGEQAVNRLSSPYGVQFSGMVQNPDKIHVSVASSFFNRASDLLGTVLKIVKKA